MNLMKKNIDDRLKNTAYWVALACIYSLFLAWLKFDQIKEKTFWLGLVACCVSVFVIKDMVLKDTMSLSIYQLQHPQHRIFRWFWFLVAVAVLVMYPFYK